jgi:hypothetical protein
LVVLELGYERVAHRTVDRGRQLDRAQRDLNMTRLSSHVLRLGQEIAIDRYTLGLSASPVDLGVQPLRDPTPVLELDLCEPLGPAPHQAG